MNVKAVVFDLDGTLVGFNLDYRALRAEVRGYLSKRGIPASVLSLKENIFEMLKKAEIFVRNSGKSAEEMAAIRSEVFGIAETYEFEAAMSTGLLSGAVETLKALKQMGLKIGLCTIDSEKSTGYVLQRFKIAEFFDVVVTRDMVGQVKPHPEHLQVVLKALSVAPENSVVVGDSSADMQCARELRAIAVGLPTGISTVPQLMSHGADYIITSITDLPVLIEKINKAQAE
ncbi:HAD family hydrolase [Candidatus Bathyarchaeota archaeon A05DMB-2]|jgi:HAD superfamily hydrolase (TIGR01509 family)|nr:HAD family hydrolase [Candidatus Bathyarchaeota archaeon A05DMB-2]